MIHLLREGRRRAVVAYCGFTVPRPDEPWYAGDPLPGGFTGHRDRVSCLGCEAFDSWRRAAAVRQGEDE